MTADHSRHACRIGVPLIAALAVLTASRIPARASEAGTSNYLPGFQDILAGVLPPPGTYLKQYLLYYQGTVSRAVAEGRVEADAKLRTPASLSVLSHVTEKRVLGSNYAVGLVVPVLKARLSGVIESPGPVRSFDKSMAGLGDVAIAPIVLGWHNGRSHTLAQFAVYAPTGNYSV